MNCEKMKLLALLPYLAPLASAAVISNANQPITYDGYKVFRVLTHGQGEEIERQLQSLKAVQYNLNTQTNIEIAVAPEDLKKFEQMELDFQLLDEDLGVSIRAEGGFYPGGEMRIASTPNWRRPGALPDKNWFQSYHSFDDHLKWLDDVQAAFSSNSELINVGKSSEGRPLKGIHLWGQGGKGSKPAVLWHGTVHAREWISTMTVEYLTWNLVNGHLNKDKTITDIIDKNDFYIIPVVNPDGFVYTQTTNRLWRKNRLKHPSSSCVGTDMNRNWPYQWNVTGGSSTSPCDETFRGLEPGNTVEIQALVAHSRELVAGKGIKKYIDWHSFSQLILLPYGYDCKKRVENYERQIALAQGTAKAIKATARGLGSTFTPGETCPDLYKAVGGSTDYMQDMSKAEISWCIELHPSGGGASGFVLPPSKIMSSVTEIWNGMMWLLPNMNK
ncbi:hypothetical protein Dda_8982 [Drechslerella dactyloides]|uniref:Peptidase M14 domain-containing protein n=1 Tax=Drechslerella dactyloides TaxID=74499 RepID=A0AAD6NFG9_DREDA|nr:hypothetical protein Dda_8982 [Drechslerella dactyloides]